MSFGSCTGATELSRTALTEPEKAPVLAVFILGFCFANYCAVEVAAVVGVVVGRRWTPFVGFGRRAARLGPLAREGQRSTK